MGPIAELGATVVVAAARAVVEAVVTEAKRNGTAVQARRDPDFNRAVGERIGRWLQQGGVRGRAGPDAPG